MSRGAPASGPRAVGSIAMLCGPVCLDQREYITPTVNRSDLFATVRYAGGGVMKNALKTATGSVTTS